MGKVYYDQDGHIEAIQDKVIAIIGYGNQGRSQALNMRDSGAKHIIVGSIHDESWNTANADGFPTYSIAEASKKADIVFLLLPDEVAPEIYERDIAPNLHPGAALNFASGYNITYGFIKPAADLDVIMVAPKSPATEERKAFLAGFGVPGLIAVKQDATGHAAKTALAMAKAMGFTRAGVLECTFEQETYEDLFGEQNVLCGGCVDLMKYGFEVLVEAGYPPEMAYFECIHELKLIVDLIYEGGIQKMNAVISNTAEFGEYYNGPKIITPDVKEKMKESLKRIESGEFAKTFLAEIANGSPELLGKRKALGDHIAEVTGRKIRSLFERKA